MVQHLHNYNLDVLPKVLRVSTHDGLRNTFVHERRHKIAKKYSNELHNAQAWFERSVLLAQSLTHLQHLQGEDLEDLPKFLRSGNLRLLGAPKEATIEIMQSIQVWLGRPLMMHPFRTSDSAILARGRIVKAKDVILFMLEGRERVGQLVTHVDVGDSVWSLCAIWEPKEGETNAFKKSDDESIWVKLEDISGVFIWRYSAYDVVVVCPPAEV